MHAAAMALAGYPSHYYTDVTSFHVPASPNLGTILNENNEQMINNFINHLFNVREKHFNTGSKLRPLLECHGALHVISKGVIRSAKGFHVTDKVLEDSEDRLAYQKHKSVVKQCREQSPNGDSYSSERFKC